MEKEFVPYELALRMKALGFDVPCFAYFLNSILQYPAWEKDYSYFNEMSDINSNLKKYEHVLAPTWQSAFAWFISQIGDEFKVCLGEKGWYIYNLENEIFEGQKALEKLCEIV